MLNSDFYIYFTMIVLKTLFNHVKKNLSKVQPLLKMKRIINYVFILTDIVRILFMSCIMLEKMADAFF